MTSDLLNRAFALHQKGSVDEAAVLYKQVIATDPHHPDALHMLGIIAHQKGNEELALGLVEAALGANPNMAMAWHNRCLILRILGRRDDALYSAEQAVAIDPVFAEAWDMAGFLWREKKELERSRLCHERAVALRPDDLKFLGNYALLLYALGDLQKSHAVMRRIESEAPDMMLQTLGNILKSAGYPEEALRYFERTCARSPHNHELWSMAAMAHLQIGDFAEGWCKWEKRGDMDQRFQHVPLWQGQPVGHLLLHEDQGMGDALQFLRYIPLLRLKAKTITLQVTPPLVRLLRHNLPDIHILSLDEPVPQADARLRLMSLPPLFGGTLDDIPVFKPYLSADEAWVKPWEQHLQGVAEPRIGFVWAGNPDHLNDRNRSVPFAELVPLLRVGAGYGVSLQKGRAKADISASSYPLLDVDAYLGDYADTAGLMTKLDLLVTVDTSVAHLAGAMGRPVWLLLPFDPDWRWMLGRADTPWYPTMRLFRQMRPGDWSVPIDYAVKELSRLLLGDTSVLKPHQWPGGILRRHPQAVVFKAD